MPYSRATPLIWLPPKFSVEKPYIPAEEGVYETANSVDRLSISAKLMQACLELLVA